MGTEGREISHDVPPYIRVYADGTIQRLAATEFAPAAFDPATGVTSKDVVIDPVTGVFARIYRPANAGNNLPLVVYFHGGAFFLSSVGDPNYHGFLNVLVAKVNAVLVSVNYRKAPEHPLPAAYDDSWAALQWIAGKGAEDSLIGSVDFSRVFLAGDSAGANISHHMAIKSRKSDPILGLKFEGIIMIHPYFWGENPIGIEVEDEVRKAMVDKWWGFVCPSNQGGEDSLINPFVNGGVSVLADLACERIIVCVAGKDILRDRGKLYYESLVKSEWGGKAEIIETEEEDHVFHIFDPYSDNAVQFVKRLNGFINQNILLV
nr:probable carboxylesterase 2 [Ipomoea batatas]